MKLRLQSNSIRFRLKQGDVTQFAEALHVEESVVMGAGPENTFLYALEASNDVDTPRVRLQPRGLVVQLPAETVRRWAEGSDVGIEAVLPIRGAESLRLLIEKDFACLHGPSEDNVDTFPHPLAEAEAEA